MDTAPPPPSPLLPLPAAAAAATPPTTVGGGGFDKSACRRRHGRLSGSLAVGEANAVPTAPADVLSLSRGGPAPVGGRPLPPTCWVCEAAGPCRGCVAAGSCRQGVAAGASRCPPHGHSGAPPAVRDSVWAGGNLCEVDPGAHQRRVLRCQWFWGCAALRAEPGHSSPPPLRSTLRGPKR